MVGVGVRRRDASAVATPASYPVASDRFASGRYHSTMGPTSRFSGAVKGPGVCAVSGAALSPGTPIVAALCELDSDADPADALPGLGLVRRDYAVEAWNDTEVPAGVVCHWRTSVPEPAAGPRALDEEVLLELLERLAEGDDDPARERLRLVVALVLLRRRRLRLVDRLGRGDEERWVLEHRPKEGEAWTVEVAARAVGDADAGEVAEALGELFGTDAAAEER